MRAALIFRVASGDLLRPEIVVGEGAALVHQLPIASYVVGVDLPSRHDRLFFDLGVRDEDDGIALADGLAGGD